MTFLKQQAAQCPVSSFTMVRSRNLPKGLVPKALKSDESIARHLMQHMLPTWCTSVLRQQSLPSGTGSTNKRRVINGLSHFRGVSKRLHGMV